jgi:hypothetical protein
MPPSANYGESTLSTAGMEHWPPSGSHRRWKMRRPGFVIGAAVMKKSRSV